MPSHIHCAFITRHSQTAAFSKCSTGLVCYLKHCQLQKPRDPTNSELTNTEVDEIPKQVRGCWKMLNMRKKAWLVWDKEWTDWSPRQCLVAQLKKVSKLAFPVQGLHCLEELGLQVSAGTALPTAATLCPDVTVAPKLQLCLRLLLTSPMYLAVAENSRGATACCKHPFKHLLV